MTSRIHKGWVLAAALAMVAAAAYPLAPAEAWPRLGLRREVWPQLFLFTIPVSVAAIIAWAGAHRNWHRRRAPYLVLAISTSLFFLGEFTWWIYMVMGQDPYPSVADVVFLLAYMPLGATAVLLVRGSAEPDQSSWIDAGVLALIAGLGLWVFVIQTASATDDRLVSRLFTMAYPICDLLVVALILRLVLHRGAKTPATVAFTVGVSLMLVADTTFTWLDLRGQYAAGTVEPVWVAGYLTFAAAGLLPGAGDAPRPADERFGLERGRLALVLGSVLVPLGVLIGQFVSSGMWGGNTASAALVVSTCVVCLVAIRLWGLLGRARRVAARRGEKRLSALVHHSTDAIMLVDAAHRVVFASPAVHDIWDLTAEEMIGRPVLGMVADEGRVSLERALQDSSRSNSDTPVTVSTLTRTNNAVKVLEGTLRNLTEDPAVEAHVLTLRDVTQARAMEAELEHRAMHDSLTGLANRALFLDRVQNAIDRHDRNRAPATAVVFIDLDDFKAVNDGMGHGAGDTLLEAVAERLLDASRRGDTVARLGGDEFALLLENLTHPEDAVLAAERTLESLRAPMILMDVELEMPASAGIAFVDERSTVESLLRDADIAMYEAKASGKNTVAVFDGDLLAAAHRRLELKVALPGALGRGEFNLAYQPIRDGTLGRLYGFEALLRWNHPELGQVSPAELIPNAEDSGQILEIGRWVLHQACAQATAWNAVHPEPLSINVNVSGVQLRDPAFVTHVMEVLAAHAIPAPLLGLEVTESVLVESLSCVDVLQQLRSLGVRIAIDDFGTGYSSLVYLHKLPVTSVKIDRGFIAELDDPRDAALVRSILALAHSLDLATVAEGVETAKQLETLAELNCGFVQGYHIARPQSAADIDQMLAAIAAEAQPQSETA